MIRRIVKFRPVVLIALVFGLGSCAPLIQEYEPPAQEEPFLNFVPLPFKDLEGWKADEHLGALQAFIASCGALGSDPDTTPLGPETAHGTLGDLRRICSETTSVDVTNPIAVQFFFESRFQPYLVRDSLNDAGKFTGYYEAEIRASFAPDSRYRYPIYARPKDIIQANLGQFDPDRRGQQLAGRVVEDEFVPYFTRSEIEQGALRGRGLEIMFADSLVDVFFLHVQGSGNAILPNGTSIRVAFSGRNGHRYTAIGRELVARGQMKLEDVSLGSLRAWMEANPIGAIDLMHRNKSFIFFRLNKGAGPIGAQNVVLTPGRSLAVDRKYFRLGLPIWLDTTDPRDPKNEQRIRRLMVAQDTGAAIKGIVRGDFYWGSGVSAENAAGRMNEEGRYFVLFPKAP